MWHNCPPFSTEAGTPEIDDIDIMDINIYVVVIQLYILCDMMSIGTIRCTATWYLPTYLSTVFQSMYVDMVFSL